MFYFTESEELIWGNFAKLFSLSKDQLDKFKRYYCLLVQENEKISLTTITGLEDIINYHFIDSLMVSGVEPAIDSLVVPGVKPDVLSVANGAKAEFDFEKVNFICDVGAGAGFPGIPLKILYPEKSLLLIEVVNKKVKFLEKVIQELELENAFVTDLDWRTFLRQEGAADQNVLLKAQRGAAGQARALDAKNLDGQNSEYELDGEDIKEEQEIDFFCARASLQPEELVRIFKSSCKFNGAMLVYWAAENWQPDKKVQEFVCKQLPYVVGNRNRKLVYLASRV